VRLRRLVNVVIQSDRRPHRRMIHDAVVSTRERREKTKETAVFYLFGTLRNKLARGLFKGEPGRVPLPAHQQRAPRSAFEEAPVPMVGTARRLGAVTQQGTVVPVHVRPWCPTSSGVLLPALSAAMAARHC
jgi:hypothetical protein